jgi:uroporphyrin-III C-methyltransferase
MNSIVDGPAWRAARRPPHRRGRVVLVGAGPGDPDLLTLRAARLLAEAECVVVDHLVSAEVLALVNPGARVIDAGKESGHHAMAQEDINALLVRLAREGREVVRLKGGDPFVFGRGGEELQALAAAGVRFEVVPGITAGSGVATYAGIPLTHRDFAQSVTFVTGHLRAGSTDAPDWTALARPRQTVVIYMGLAALPEICRQLVAHGRDASCPAAVVQQGTTREQRVVSGTLADLPPRVAAAHLRSPCLVIVGEVVRLREQLAWFEAPPEPLWLEVAAV